MDLNDEEVARRNGDADVVWQHGRFLARGPAHDLLGLACAAEPGESGACPSDVGVRGSRRLGCFASCCFDVEQESMVNDFGLVGLEPVAGEEPTGVEFGVVDLAAVVIGVVVDRSLVWLAGEGGVDLTESCRAPRCDDRRVRVNVEDPAVLHPGCHRGPSGVVEAPVAVERDVAIVCGPRGHVSDVNHRSDVLGVEIGDVAGCFENQVCGTGAIGGVARCTVGLQDREDLVGKGDPAGGPCDLDRCCARCVLRYGSGWVDRRRVLRRGRVGCGCAVVGVREGTAGGQDDRRPYGDLGAPAGPATVLRDHAKPYARQKP